jgi:simple sugar transport system ATP-binding protein
VQALDEVSLEIKSGEILAILGENGAGKSTLMKILSGLYQADSGIIKINHQWFTEKESDEHVLAETLIPNPRWAKQLGIGMVYQHFQLVGPFTVTENIVIGKEFTHGKSPVLNRKVAEEEVKKLGVRYGLPIDPRAKVEDLPVGLRQRVEILKQLYRDAELLILDEPTAVLTPTEVDELFKTMRSLKEAGKSLIFISHKLKEPLAIADRIVVMRRGKMVGETLPAEATEKSLAEMVVGKKVQRSLERLDIKSKELVFDITNLKVFDPITQKYSVSDISFQGYKNQIVGIAGVQGNGQTELVEALMGLREVESGSIKIYDDMGNSIELTEKSTLDTIRTGIGYIPEDRTKQGLVLDFQVSENIWLAYHGIPDVAETYVSTTGNGDEDEVENDYDILGKITSTVLLPFKLIHSLSSIIVQQFDIRTPSIETLMRNLSGGNQQKVLIGREFAKNPRFIVASQPTRGVDIGVMNRVHEELIDKRNDGASVLLVSSDLDEVLALSDVIVIMYEGKAAGYGPLSDFDMHKISQLMTTGHEEKTEKPEVAK